MNTEFVLRCGDNVKDSKIINTANKNAPLFSNGGESEDINISFNKNIFTKKELENYYIDIYIFKDPKFKTFMGSYKVPSKSIYLSK